MTPVKAIRVGMDDYMNKVLWIGPYYFTGLNQIVKGESY